MRLSIIIPLYNKQDYIYNTIKSITSQDYNDYEIIIVNDGSTDASEDVVRRMSDSRIRLINKPNEGVSSARNRGVVEAKGDYIYFLDADDVIMPNALSLFEEMLCEASECDMLVASFIEKNEIGQIAKHLINKKTGEVSCPLKAFWKKDLFIRMGNIFVKRKVITRIGLMRTDITLYEDFEWILRLLQNSKVYCSNKIIMEYRRYKSGLSYKKTPISRDYAGHISLWNVNNQYEKLILADFLVRRLVKRILNGDYIGAMKIIKNNLSPFN